MVPELLVPRLGAGARGRPGADPRQRGRALADDELRGYVDGLLADTREGTSRPAGYEPSTHLWWVAGITFLGRVHVRHRLTPFLREVGGHLGYHVVPPYRRRGHATAMLAAALPVAAALQIECLLLTCDADNLASRRVIEANGGCCRTSVGTSSATGSPPLEKAVGTDVD